MAGFYDGTELLSQMDIEGIRPEVYMCQTNNSAGKTTWFTRWLIKKFKNTGELFMLVYRYEYELDDVDAQFFEPVHKLFFPNDTMTIQKDILDKGDKKTGKKATGYVRLFLNNVHCGFAVCLNGIDAIKKHAHVFNTVSRIFMDEFQSETNKYLPQEARKMWALHKAISRGGGSQSRYVPLIMCANPITLLNPYYSQMNVAARLKSNTRFLKGKGWVLEQGFNESAAKALSESRFNIAFSEGDEQYLAYSTQGVYLNDNLSFIEKLSGKSRYLLTITANGKQYGVRVYESLGYVYCDNTADPSYPITVALTTDDHTASSLLIAKSNNMIKIMRQYFDAGLFRFKNLECKEIIFKLLSY